VTTELTQHEQRGLTVADPEEAAGALAHILATGDLAQLSNQQRVAYYLALCSSLALNSLSRPFDWLLLDKRLVLYPNKSCAEQLRRNHQISVKVVRREMAGELYVVEVEGSTPDGRVDFASKYVPVTRWSERDGRYVRLAGNDLANAYHKAETGAKRRLVLSMVGLAGLPDELTGAVRTVTVDAHGRILDAPTEEQRHLAEHPEVARAIGEPTFETTASPDDAPLPSTASQGARASELAQRMRPAGPRPSFRASEEDVKRWLGAWFAAVKGTSLDDDEARHRYVAQWTSGEWPKAKQTDSLRTAFARMNEREAGDFLAQVRALVEFEKQALLEDADAARDLPANEPTEEVF